MTECKKCLYDEKYVPSIEFDEDGVCNYCTMTDSVKDAFIPNKELAKLKLENTVDRIAMEGYTKEYDCIVGLSGGVDSSYMLNWVVEQGLRPLAVNYNNGWGTGIADSNMHKMTSQLGVDFYSYKPEQAEVDDIFRAFFLASVLDLDSSSDIALAEALYRIADKYNVKYIFEGHSFATEGISPLDTLYMDGKYIESVHNKYGTVALKTFPNMTLSNMLKWTAYKKIRKIRPFWYINYSRSKSKAFLTEEFGWEYYSGHHMENKMTDFHHNYYVYNKSGYDARKNSLSAKIRSGKITKEEALNVLKEPPLVSAGLVDSFKDRLSFTDKEFNEVMAKPIRPYTDFDNYKKDFVELEPLFRVLSEKELVPASFYLKYCK